MYVTLPLKGKIALRTVIIDKRTVLLLVNTRELNVFIMTGLVFSYHPHKIHHIVVKMIG